MKTLACLTVSVTALLLTGCPPQGDVMPSPVALVAGMEMEVNPQPADWDGRPGPDGIEVRVRLYRSDPVRAVPVSGTLEFLLFEGVLRAEQIAQAKPLRTWSYVGEPLHRHASRDIVGWSYMLRLDWGDDVPQADALTLISRYRLPDGRWLTSDPNSAIVIAKP